MPSNTGAGVASSDTSPRDRFEQIIRADTVIWPALDIARSLALPDWLIASGAVYQSIWNALIGRPCGYGLKDIDLIYFDDSDLSWGAEDNCIRKADAAFRAVNLGVPVETRNQARVHLWFEDKFGVPYAPLTSSAESLSRYESTASAIGIRLDDNDRLHIIAPLVSRMRWPCGFAPTPILIKKSTAPTIARLRAAKGSGPKLNI